MYAAKKKGKKNCLLYREEMNIENSKKYEMINDLKKALNNNEFKLFYQPKVDITSNTIVGFEALIRWFHPEKGIIPPSDFIPLAEEIGLILPLGEWVLRKACTQNKKWQESGYGSIKIAVNLSTHQFEHPSLIGTVKKILLETNLDPSLLELEITESIAVTCFECALTKLKHLKKLGVTIAIDDFGTGYSSFNYLRLLPIDTLKIDKIFLDNLMSHPNEQLITASMIDLGRRLNLTVIAEGVENEKQLSFIKKHQCNIAQGYLFSKPLPVEEIEKLLEHGAVSLSNTQNYF
jgi:EAL domain-containing protein (putative c-di-GMP-specific phosphodiesterase class I)